MHTTFSGGHALGYTKYSTVGLCALALGCLSLANAQDTSDRLYTAVRNDDRAGLTSLVKIAGVDARDKRGTTPLMYAAAHGSLEAMQLLIAAGADVNAKNAFDATALMWCATDLAKVRLLVSKGADVNARSRQGHTPLLIAAHSDGAVEIVRLLLDKGADIGKAAANPVNTPLAAASNANDAATVRLLLERGATTKGPDAMMALMNASGNGNLEMMRMLIERGVDVNCVSPPTSGPGVKHGPVALGLFTPLILAAAYGGPDAVKMLLDAKANPNAQDVRGMTPLMLALATDRPDVRVVRLLVARGADPGIKSKDGETAADWARKFNHPEVLKALSVSGSARVLAVRHDPPAPRQAVEKSVAVLQRTTGTFFVEGGCAACHAQNLTAMAVDAARTAGLAVDLTASATYLQQSKGFWGAQDQTLLIRMDPPGGSDMLDYGIAQFLADRLPPGAITDSIVHNLAAQQQADGSWHSMGVARPPMEDGDFGRTAFAIRALQTYGAPARKTEFAARVERAAKWLRNAHALTTEDANMQLLGLKWAGADRTELKPLADRLALNQGTDGGWAQTPYLGSDAYATGQTLYTMHELGVPAGNERYRRGVEFLLSTPARGRNLACPEPLPEVPAVFPKRFPARSRSMDFNGRYCVGNHRHHLRTTRRQTNGIGAITP